MIARCLEEESEFGIVWLADDGLRADRLRVRDRRGARADARRPASTSSRAARGRSGSRRARTSSPYPAGIVEFLDDRDEELDAEAAAAAHGAYADLVEQATDKHARPGEIDAMTRLRDGGDGRVRARRQAGPARPALGVRAAEARRAPVPRRDQAPGLHRPRPGPRALATARSTSRAEQRARRLAGHVERRLPVVGGARSAPWSSSSSSARRRRCARRVQRRVAALLGDVRVRARLEQRAHRRRGRRPRTAEWSGRTLKVFSASASGSAPVARIARTASAPPKNAARCSGVKPSPPRTLRSAPASALDVAERGRLERSDRRARREQRVARLRPAVVEREQQRRDAVLVARVGELRLLAQQRGQVVGRDGGDEVHAQLG